MTELAAWLRARMKERRLSQRGLEKYSGVSKSQISRILREDHTPKPDDLLRLANYFEIHPVTMFEIAGIIEVGDMEKLDPQIRSLMRTIADLDPSLQVVVGEAWAKNLELALKMLQEGQHREREQEQARSEQPAQ